VHCGSLSPQRRYPLPFDGTKMYVDYELRAAVQSGGHVTQQKDLGLNVAQTTTFGEGLDGELYAASRAGKLYALVR
jgi:hypothetical protein